MEGKILFPFKYLEQFFLGKLDWDIAVNKTIDEMNRLIEEYVEDNNLFYGEV